MVLEMRLLREVYRKGGNAIAKTAIRPAETIHLRGNDGSTMTVKPAFFATVSWFFLPLPLQCISLLCRAAFAFKIPGDGNLGQWLMTDTAFSDVVDAKALTQLTTVGV